ncbi:MAG: M28 family peptidase [Candidatus Aminicenantes bacterium]|nr:M28 family peptidase [Candidatus Aminicenantes bacterium]
MKACKETENLLLPIKLFLACSLLLFSYQSSLPALQESSVFSEDPASYKAFIDKIISPEKMDRYLRIFTSEPHVASSARNNELAEFVLKEWKSFGLDEVYLAPYDVLLSFPEDIRVELVSPRKIKLNLKEKAFQEDPDTSRPDAGIPYNAYSRSGDITAPLVYAYSGNPKDYDFLEKKGINLKGKIALVRYSAPYSYRGFKAYAAEKRGLAGLLIYSDPEEDGFSRGPVFPHGPWGPLSHIQRGGIPYDFIYPGDPLTPGWPSTAGCRRIPAEEAFALPRIMSVPLSAEDALPLLESIGGEEAPEEWRGALPVTYRLGGSQARVLLRVKMKNPIQKIINVIGCIKGTGRPEEIVLVGNHRDAWVYGGHDPSSGTACLMEMVRAFAEAKKAGLKPRRTIYFGNWDAEEFTLTGSTEWGEENKEWLRKNLVAYLNVDSSASGRDFSVQAVPCLSPLVIQTLKEVKDPASGKTVYDCWKSGSSKKGTIVLASGSGKIDPLGSGTDHTVFLNHIGAPALNMSFSGDYGVYHSVYDDYYWMSHFGDPGMLYSAALARIWSRMVIDLACSPLLPLDYENYARELEKYLEDWAAQHDPSRKISKNLFSLIREMIESASRSTPYLLGSKEIPEDISSEMVRKVNRLLIEIERDFIDPRGIPNRNWFKHLIFGCRYTYAVLLLPSLTEAAEAGNKKAVFRSLRSLEKSLKKVNAKLEKIAVLLDVHGSD